MTSQLSGRLRTAALALGAILCLSAWAQPAGITPQAVALRSADHTEINAWLVRPVPRQPDTADTARPVVVALHGCGGLLATGGSRKGQLNARHQGMAELLSAQGWAVLFPDSFTARGMASLCTVPLSDRKLTPSVRRADVDGALAWLAAQPWADPRRIALLGWSHGGSTVLASIDASEAAVQARPLQPDVAVAFYPGCGDALRSGWRPHVPLVLMLAQLDDWTPAAPCMKLAQRTGAQAHVYPDSWHDFDNPVGQVQWRRDVPNGVHPGQGVHAGRNPVTGPQAWSDLVELLRARWN